MTEAGPIIFPFHLSVDSLLSWGFTSYLTLLFHVPNKLQKWVLLSYLKIRKFIQQQQNSRYFKIFRIKKVWILVIRKLSMHCLFCCDLLNGNFIPTNTSEFLEWKGSICISRDKRVSKINRCPVQQLSSNYST